MAIDFSNAQQLRNLNIDPDALATEISTAGLPLTGGTLTGALVLSNATSVAFTDTSANVNTTIGTTAGNLWTLTGSSSGGGQRTVLSFPMHDATNTLQVSTPFKMINQTTFSGAFSSSTTLTPPLLANITALTGSVTSGGANVFSHVVAADTLNTTTGGSAPLGGSYLSLSANFGGAAMTGHRNGVSSIINLTAPSGNLAADTRFYTAAASKFMSGVSDNGISGTPSGNGFAGNDIALLTNGATFWNSLIGREIDVSVATGASVQQVIGLQIVQFSSHQVAGLSGKDAALQFANGPAGPAVGWDKVISFGAPNGWWPLKTTGTLIGTATATIGGGPTYSAAYGIDLSGVTFSGAAIKLPLLTNAANDAAAASAGVDVGAFYRNGSVVMQRVT